MQAMRDDSIRPSPEKMTRFRVLRLIASTCVVLLLFSLLDGETGRPAAEGFSRDKVWTFDESPPGALPESLKVGTLFDGRPAGDWKILITGRAKSASQVLAQIGSKGSDQAYKLVLFEDTTSSNVDLEVSFLAVSGKTDLGGGLIWRARDDRNYYLLRASAVEQNIPARI